MRWICVILFSFIFINCTHKPPIPPKEMYKNPVTIASNNSSIDNKSSIQSNKEIEDSSTIDKTLSPSEIFENISPAVFKIYTSTGTQEFQGSGFFITNNGIAVSNYHVFKGTTIGLENIILSDGSTFKIEKVFYKSEIHDFIIFKVNIPNKVCSVKIANITPKIGEKIYTIGSPRGLDNTFSSGEISQIRDNGNILQISAPIDHGSSGGILLNSKGEAVGITSGGIDESGANLNYAINIKLIIPYLP